MSHTAFLRSDADVALLSAHVYHGMSVERVSVPDISEDARHAAARAETQAEITSFNSTLAREHSWAAPGIGASGDLEFNNPVAALMFDSAPGLKLWRERLVPRAIALTALYEAESWTLPTGEPLDLKTRSYFLHSLDAIGIRTRASILSSLVPRYVQPGSVTAWTSIACGAAIPVLNALVHTGAGCPVEATLVDNDQEALDHAREKAERLGLAEGEQFRLLRRNVISDLIVSDALVRELGIESQNLVDMLGIFEYLNEEFAGRKSAATFLANAFQLVKPGGALVGANMLDTHPQIHFNQRGIGWPRLFPRSLGEIHRIILDAGIDPGWVTLRIPADGIYAVFEIAKPGLCSELTTR